LNKIEAVLMAEQKKSDSHNGRLWNIDPGALSVAAAATDPRSPRHKKQDHR
jgi:hypothetical protein